MWFWLERQLAKLKTINFLWHSTLRVALTTHGQNIWLQSRYLGLRHHGLWTAHRKTAPPDHQRKLTQKNCDLRSQVPRALVRKRKEFHPTPASKKPILPKRYPNHSQTQLPSRRPIKTKSQTQVSMTLHSIIQYHILFIILLFSRFSFKLKCKT